MSVYRKKGRLTYTMDFIFHGQRVYKSTGSTDKKRAQKIYDEYREAIRTGKLGLESDDQLYHLQAATEDWLRHGHEPWSPSMQEIVDRTLNRILPWFGKDRLLALISHRDIKTYQEARLANTPRPSNRLINMEVSSLRKILRHAGHWDRMRKKVHMLEERENVGKALTLEQEKLLLEECSRSTAKALLPFVTLALDTGARYDTIRTLQWERVDFRHGTIRIGKDKTKAGSGRIVPLNTRSLRTLQFWAEQFPHREPEHYVFPVEMYGLHGAKGRFGGEVRRYAIDPSRPLGTLQQGWEAAKRRTQLHCPACADGRFAERKPARQKRSQKADPKPTGYACMSCGFTIEKLPEALSTFRFHDLRHTACSRMVEAGVPLHIVAEVVGWEPGTVVAMAKRYSHFTDDAKRRAVEAITMQPPPAVPGESTGGKAANSGVVQ